MPSSWLRQTRRLCSRRLKANAGDIPVILVNDTIDEEAAKAQGRNMTYIGTVDNYQGGVVGGEFINEKIRTAQKSAY